MNDIALLVAENGVCLFYGGFRRTEGPAGLSGTMLLCLSRNTSKSETASCAYTLLDHRYMRGRRDWKRRPIRA